MPCTPWRWPAGMVRVSLATERAVLLDGLGLLADEVLARRPTRLSA